MDANSRDENVTWTDETYSDFLAQPHLEDEEEQSDTEEDGSYHMCWRRHPTMFQTRKRRRHSPLNVRFALGFEFLLVDELKFLSCSSNHSICSAPLALLRSRSVEGDRQSRSYEVSAALGMLNSLYAFTFCQLTTQCFSSICDDR